MSLAVISLKWVHREIHGKPPSPRQGHSACLIGDVAYIFGGIRSVDWPKKGTYFFRDLYQLHLFKRMQWEKVKQRGEIPKGRYGHHMCVIGHKIYLFGGKHELKADRCIPGLHVYDTEKKVWSQPQTSGTEPVAHSSTSSVVRNRIYVYGGLVDGQAVDDIHCFDSENQWWVKLTVQGVPPSPRCDSASTSVGHEIFVFGGTAGIDQWFNDIHVFNTKKLLWKELNKTDGEKPTPRGSHCFLAHVDKDVYVFGGSNDSNTAHPTLGDLYKFSLDKRKWKRPFYGGCPPAKRSGHASIIHRNKLIVIGGSNEDTDFNDVHIAKLINPSKRQPLKVPASDMHDFLNNINNPEPRPMVVDGEDAEAHFHEKEEEPEPIPEGPTEGSEMDNDQQTGSHASGSRDGSIAGSETDLKGTPGKSVHFEDDAEGKQDAVSLSSSAGSLASSAGSLSSSASSSSASSKGSSASSDSTGSDVPGSSNNNNNSNNNNAVIGVGSGIGQGYSEHEQEGGTENTTKAMSGKDARKENAEAAHEGGYQLAKQDNQVEGSSIPNTRLGDTRLAPIDDTEPKTNSKKGRKSGPKTEKPKKNSDRLKDETQHPLPMEHRPYPPMESYSQRFQEEIARNNYPEDWSTPNHLNLRQAQEEQESDKDNESESESESESGSESSSEEDSDGDDDDEEEDSEKTDDGGNSLSTVPEEQNRNTYDESQSYRPSAQERQSESGREEDESGSDDDDDEEDNEDEDDSGSEDDDSGSDTGSESGSDSGSGSGEDSESEED